MRSPSGIGEAETYAVIRKSLADDNSTTAHVTGATVYVDDVREPAGTLHLAPGYAPIAAGRISALDLAAVRKAPGVVAVLTAKDIPGANDISPNGTNDDPLIVSDVVSFYGQVAFAVVAETRRQARRAVRFARMATAPSMPVIDVGDALVSQKTLAPERVFERGEIKQDLEQAPRQATGEFTIGGQEHFYLEDQVALAVQSSDGVSVCSSTQHPSVVQHVVARVLGRRQNEVTVETRRVGGSFGGKTSQASQWAGLAALGAHVTRRPCKIRLDRDDDMIMTGKRHDYRVDYHVGFDNAGLVRSADVCFNTRCGHSEDLGSDVVDQTMFHADNAYYYPSARILGRSMRTNTVTNTAFRGSGGPQGMVLAERLMDHIAFVLGRDPLDVRKANLYGGAGRDRTPYGMRVGDNIALELVVELERSCAYRARRKELASFNATSPVLKKGLALTPVKFGVGFPQGHLNQAAALVALCRDGSIRVDLGSTETGQGLFVKVAQVVAEEFGVGFDDVKVSATSSAIGPPIAASAGVNLNAQAALAACRTIKDRLCALIEEKSNVSRKLVLFRDGKVTIGGEAVRFRDIVDAAFHAGIPLASTGFRASSKIDWDGAKATGSPFLYFVYGAACSEVTIDTMTGEHRVDRVDILQDVGKSLNPAIDIGQIEGGFVQGMGWLTSEELVWDSAGRLVTDGAVAYKIPTASDLPRDFRVALYGSGVHREDTTYGSKAVGSPPIALAISIFSAISDAIASLKPGMAPRLNIPATPEAIMRAIRAGRGDG